MIEYRFAPIETGNKTVSGYGLKWNGLTRYNGQTEMFLPDAFEEKRTDLCLEHEQKVSEAIIESDSIGLKFQSQVSESIANQIKEKRFKGASVGFTSIKEHRNEYGDRIIEKAKLNELSLVQSPAHLSSHIEVRSKENDLWKFEIELLRMEI